MPLRTLDAELFHRAPTVLGEGPFWHAGRLHWVDILESRLYSCDARGGDPRFLQLPSHVGAAAPWAGGFIAATQQGLGRLTPNGEFSVLPKSPRLPPEIRFNDGKLDARGRFWCGSMAYGPTRELGALYRVDQNGEVTQLLDRVSISNGLDWDVAAKLFYYIDTPTCRVDVFDYDEASGAIANRRTAFETPQELGFPDGMTRDPQGRLWIAFWGGGHVIAFDPATGRQLCRIKVPARLSTSCWINAESGRMYITSARVKLTPEQLAEQPLSGSVFCVKLADL